MEECYKQLSEAHPKNPVLTCEAAEYFASTGVYSKATKLYQRAFSFNQDESLKISHIMDGIQERAAAFAEKATNHDFYNFNSVNPEALQTLIGDLEDNL